MQLNKQLKYEIAETVANYVAKDIISSFIGSKTVLGKDIEEKLTTHCKVIYQYIEDSEFFGATIKYDNGMNFILLNSYQPRRMRYFSAAHEFWHLFQINGLSKEFEHERAADHFAALIMIPEEIAFQKWYELRNDYSIEEIIIYASDYFSVPYETMTRRFKELGLIVEEHYLSISEFEWFEKRKNYKINPTELDEPEKIIEFEDYSSVIKEMVKFGSLTKMEGSIKLAHVSPEESEIMQSEIINKEDLKDE